MLNRKPSVCSCRHSSDGENQLRERDKTRNIVLEFEANRKKKVGWEIYRPPPSLRADKHKRDGWLGVSVKRFQTPPDREDERKALLSDTISL